MLLALLLYDIKQHIVLKPRPESRAILHRSCFCRVRVWEALLFAPHLPLLLLLLLLLLPRRQRGPEGEEPGPGLLEAGVGGAVGGRLAGPEELQAVGVRVHVAEAHLPVAALQRRARHHVVHALCVWRVN